MINLPDLTRRLAGKHVKDDALMPKAYQTRTLHDDWGIWPFTRIPRRLTWYNLPLPFKFLAGNYEPRWMPWQEGYPQSPAAILRPVQPGTAAFDLRERFGKDIRSEVLAHDPVPPAGCWGRFAVWLDEAWRECLFTTKKRLPFGKIWVYNGPVKFDITWGDFGVQAPDIGVGIRSA